MKKKIIKLSIFLTIFIIAIYFLINSMVGNKKFSHLKMILSNDQKQLIKKYIFPYKIITLQNNKIINQNQKILRLDQGLQLLKHYLPVLELDKKESLTDIQITESIIKISHDKNLKKYKLNSGFYHGIYHPYPGSGYIDFFENNIFVLSVRGVLAFRKDLTDDKVNFKQIKNNINDFIGINQFRKFKDISLKDLSIFDNKIYVSYTEEIEENCWNTSVISGNINYENILFKKLFSSNDCVHSIDNIDKQFSASQAGGRIVKFFDDYILLSIGDYSEMHLAQNTESVAGKIIKINIKNGDHEIISMGHRNPQGLLFDKENNFILETEHGPMGGDEINLIKVDSINKNKIQNYGWPIASYGEHYGSTEDIKTKKKYEKYPLHKSHSEHGFIEPLKAFVPAIAISEIVKIEQNKYVVSSMGRNRSGDKSLYFFELNDEKKIINLEQIKVFERVRDLKFKDNKLYLFMEDTASIGVINLN